MNVEDAIAHLRTQIESQGPDTPNRHYGRNQYNYLIECVEVIEETLGLIPPADAEVLLQRLAMERLEEMDDDLDKVSRCWLTADDIASRLRDILREHKYWWQPS